MSFNYDSLLGKIKEVCKTQDAFADKMGISRTALNLRLNNKADFKAKEMKKACEVLKISVSDIPIYFFCTESSETRTAS